MPNPYFAFKQFTIHHDRCAMKVGTDGVLLGAWTDIRHARRILDIGTGTGLIALMLAQRCPEASITAIDIDSEAVNQALENIQNSPWKERVEAYLQDIRTYQPQTLFDTIVSTDYSPAYGHARYTRFIVSSQPATHPRRTFLHRPSCRANQRACRSRRKGRAASFTTHRRHYPPRSRTQAHPDGVWT